MRKNLFFFCVLALLFLTTGCYITIGNGSNVDVVGTRIVKGEVVEYTEYGNYSAYVTVEVKHGIISKVTLSDDSKPVTGIVDWQDRPDEYYSDLREYLNSFKGKSVDEIKNYDKTTVEDEKQLDYISGCTITTDRILNAVKNALTHL
ncbi:MAG: FMN-binding protein [Bacilli bacterium]|nr:FMN-binding protein [Bacilli bacterium]